MRKLLKHLVKWFVDWLGTVPNPGLIQVQVTGDLGMALVYKVLLPQGDDLTDVVAGNLTITSTLGGEQSTNTVVTEPGQVSVDGLVGDDGTAVDLSFVYVDDAGNLSVNPVTLSVELLDTIPPADPSSLGLEITGESA